MKGMVRILVAIICFTVLTGKSQNAPVSIAGSVVSLNETVTVALYAVDFADVSSCNLKLSYDPAIAIATAVTIGPGVGGMLSSNLAMPGSLNLGWFTSGGISLPDSSVVFNIHFSRVGYGNSWLNWQDDGFSCEYYDGNFEPLNDLPTDEYYKNGHLIFQNPDGPVTRAADIAATPGNPVNLPITVTDFQMIGALSLQLNYDDEVLAYLGFDNNADYPGLIIDAGQAGTLVISGLVPEGDTALSLEDQATLLTLQFNYSGGYTELNWTDNGTSCEYRGALPDYPVLNDTPQEVYYRDGSVSVNALPLAAGPVYGPPLVCASSGLVSYSVDPIPYASSYVWQVSEGAVIISGQNTATIQVNFSPLPDTSTISVFGENEFGVGAPSSMEVEILIIPESAGPVAGEQLICPGQTDVEYSIQAVNGATGYDWIIPSGAEITSGGNTNAIIVAYGMNVVSGVVIVFPTNECGQGIASPALQVEAGMVPLVNTQPVSPVAVVAGAGTALFTLSASGTDIDYQWQEFSGSWSDVVENDIFSGVHQDTLRVINPSLEMNGKHYRCKVSGFCEPNAFTNGDAALTVLDPVTVGNIQTISGLNVFPNPFQNNLELMAEFSEKGNLVIELTDVSGKRLLAVNRTIPTIGNHSIQINTAQVQPGFYLLTLRFESETTLVIAPIRVICSNKP